MAFLHIFTCLLSHHALKSFLDQLLQPYRGLGAQRRHEVVPLDAGGTQWIHGKPQLRGWWWTIGVKKRHEATKSSN